MLFLIDIEGAVKILLIKSYPNKHTIREKNKLLIEHIHHKWQILYSILNYNLNIKMFKQKHTRRKIEWIERRIELWVSKTKMKIS